MNYINKQSSEEKGPGYKTLRTPHVPGKSTDSTPYPLKLNHTQERAYEAISSMGMDDHVKRHEHAFWRGVVIAVAVGDNVARTSTSRKRLQRQLQNSLAHVQFLKGSMLALGSISIFKVSTGLTQHKAPDQSWADVTLSVKPWL